MNIVLDNRERDLIEELKRLEFNFTIECLDVGDIEVRDSENNSIITLERKTFADWEASIIDGRYKEQKHRLLNMKHRVAYILEGSAQRHKKRKRISDNALRGSLMNTTIRDGLGIVRTESLKDTAKLVTELEKRLSKNKVKTGLQTPALKHRASKRVRMADPKIILLRQLMCIPGVSENVASKIIETYGVNKAVIIKKAKDNMEEFSQIKIGKKKLGMKLVEKIQQYL